MESSKLFLSARGSCSLEKQDQALARLTIQAIFQEAQRLILTTLSNHESIEDHQHHLYRLHDTQPVRSWSDHLWCLLHGVQCWLCFLHVSKWIGRWYNWPCWVVGMGNRCCCQLFSGPRSLHGRLCCVCGCTDSLI